MANVLRVGILGSGGIATAPYGVLPNMHHYAGRVEVVAIADVAPELARATADRFAIPAAYGSLDAMLDSADIDAVVNLTPIPVHAETSRAILARGKHLAGEKPLAATIAEADEPHYAYKLEWYKALRAAVAADAGAERPFAVLGDYNVAPTDRDVWDISRFDANSTHVTQAERDAVTALETVGLSEVMPRALKYDVPFTFWDYRDLGFPKNKGMRIDLVYGNAPFVAAVTDSYVDREARKGKGTSDHAPVVVDLSL
ncbi:exodeoxyribonuclease III [Streptomyces sp. SID3343]|uniref:exodeoxyribonuclease III n=1 Tax=Streptomyces sp. SID3343 TaxID=2690260 RepID=UPI001368992D|nr:Gfo/Idh/MocA family oxidoreductase [Streptomyces sp. SID3343]